MSPLALTYDDVLDQAMRLYDNLDTPGVLEAYARHSVTPEALAAAKQLFLDATAVLSERNLLKALAQKATETKNKNFKVLWTWWLDFKRIVHIALRNDPQLKEQVNIVVRSLY